MNKALLLLIEKELREYIASIVECELDKRIGKAVQEVISPSPLMSRKDVAEYLNCSLVTVHQMMNDGRLPYTKLGASTKFNRADVERLAKRNIKNND